MELNTSEAILHFALNFVYKDFGGDLNTLSFALGVELTGTDRGMPLPPAEARPLFSCVVPLRLRRLPARAPRRGAEQRECRRRPSSKCGGLNQR